MKNYCFQLIVLVLVISFSGCGTKKGEQPSDESDENTTGDNALYNQIMDIHDEVMPKTEKLYNISKQLKSNLKDATTDAERDLLQNQIDYFDSVNAMMMDWMHEFKPLPDTTDEEIAKAYYENHLQKVKLVREAILTALEKEVN